MVDFKKALQKQHPHWIYELPECYVPTHYTVLMVPPGIDQVGLDGRYRVLRVLHHPDRYYDGEKVAQTRIFASITEAYAVVGNAERRAQYDRELAMLGPKQCSMCMGAGLREFTGKGFRKESKLCNACSGTGQK